MIASSVQASMNWARSAILNCSRDHCLYVPCRRRWDGSVISTFIRAKWRCSRLPDNALPSSVILKPAVLVRFRGGNRTRDFSLGSPNFTLSHPFTSIPGASAKRNTNTFLPKGIKNKKSIYLFLFWTFSICWSISFIDIFPRNIAATVRYLPCRGSHAAIMFLLSNICWVSSFTVSARYCWLSRLVNGAKPGMKKWRRGNGTMFTASFLRSAFNCQERMNNGVINSCPVHAFARWGRGKGWGDAESLNQRVKGQESGN